MPDRKHAPSGLDALSSATDGLRPEDRIVDAVMERVGSAAEDEQAERPATRASEVELDAPLACLVEATASLEPHPALSDSVMESIHGLAMAPRPAAAGGAADDVLEMATRLTAELCPADGLGDEVMRAIGTTGVRSSSGRAMSAAGIAHSGRAALLVAAAVAAVSLGYASYLEQRLDTDVMVAVDPVEASE